MTSSKISTAPSRRAELAESSEKAGVRRHEAHIARDRLDDDGGDLDPSAARKVSTDAIDR